jgi:malate dehydrogenase (oxaloacetate-decarboxylating)(NADP+)
VATRPITDWAAYRSQLNNFVWHSGLIMKPVFAAARENPKRIIFSEGESEKVLRAVQQVVDEGLARPILIGRPDVVKHNIERFGLRMTAEQHYELVNPDSDPRFNELWQHYHSLTERSGVSVEYAKKEVRRRTTLIGTLLLKFGYGDGLICGTYGMHRLHREFVETVLGRREGVDNLYTVNLLSLPGRTMFLADTYVNYNPTPEQVVEMTLLAAEEMQRFGVEPRVALLSHSSFGSADSPTAQKMRTALRMLHERHPELQVEGEMHGDAALSDSVRLAAFPNSRLKGDANLLIMPTIEAANIAFNLLKTASGEGITNGPLLLGAARAVHVMTPSATVRRIINMTAVAVVNSQAQRRAGA